MDKATYDTIKYYLCDDMLDMINDYFKQLVLLDLNRTFRLVYPRPLKVWKELGNEKSSLTMVHPYSNFQIRIKRTLVRDPLYTNKFKNLQRIEKQFGVRGRSSWSNNQINQPWFGMQTRNYDCLNKRCHILDYAMKEKTELIFHAMECGVKVYKSWTKRRLIEALIKAD